MFRPDIEGLRAVAVVAVVLFHVGAPGFSGGFVGVDVFFVVSGFLLVGHVVEGVDAGTFSASRYLAKRVRRIVPLLLVVALATALAAPFVMLPNDLERVANGVFGAEGFVSNFVFQRLTADYFEAGKVAWQPLLHTWSLSVEAQFYLLLPLLGLGLRGRGRTTRLVVVGGIAAASLALAAWQVGHGRGADAFYLLPARAWEFLLGGLAWLLPRRGARAPALGLALVAGSVAVLTPETPFPGVAALPACLGAALVVAGDGRGGVARLLGAPVPRLLGRLSYALYLWHWPIVAFLRYRSGAPLTAPEAVAAILASLALAALSHRLVEAPVLARRALPGGRALAGALAGGLVAVGLAGAGLLLVGQGRLAFATLPPAVLALSAGERDRIDGDCAPEGGGTRLPCRFGVEGAAPGVLLWGDSYARMWVGALDGRARRAGVAGTSALLTLCQPVTGVEVPSRPGCAAFDARALAFALAHPELRRVVLAAHWIAYDYFAPGLEASVAALAGAGREVTILLAPPQPGLEVPRLAAMAALRGEPPPAPLDLAAERARDAGVTATIEAIARRHGARVLDPAPLLCERGACPLVAAGRALYYDAGHVSLFGAERAAALLDPVFAGP